MTTPIRSIVAKLLGRFKENTAGVAAIEFAYILPLMILMSLGVFEVSRAVMMHKRFQRASAMVGDLVAREQQMGTSVSTANAEMAGIMKAAEHVMNPYDTATLKMGVTSIRAATNNANNTTVEWSYPYHAYPVTACASVKAMPASGMITAGNAAIVVESEYMYKPFLNNLIPGFKTQFLWQDTITHAPRNASVVYGCEQSCGGGCP